mgnify:CR=1 FL=1
MACSCGWGRAEPAVLLSQLHQACPELFVAPSSLDDDLVIALPPQKVQRLVARVEPGVGPQLPQAGDDQLDLREAGDRLVVRERREAEEVRLWAL